MISLSQAVQALGLEVLTGEELLDREVRAGYASDLLSCAMARAKEGCLWVTLQSHVNVVAVASLTNLAGVVVTEGRTPDPETLARAREEGVALLATPRTTFAVVSALGALGVPGVEALEG